MYPTFIDSTEPLEYNDYGTPPGVPYVVNSVTIGPIEVNDPSQELNDHFWAAYYDDVNEDIVLENMDNSQTEIIFNEQDGVTNIGLAFDQNANDVYAWITGLGVLKLRWFDASIPGDTIVSLGSAQSVVITMDTKYFPSSASSDILLFYIRDGAIFYRVQRDKYQIEYASPVTSGAISLKRIGTTTGYRTQVVYSSSV